MSKDIQEDFKDMQEISKQKQEQKKTGEKLENWEFGKGVKPEKDSKPNVRS